MHKIELTEAERHALIAAAVNERTRNRERRDAPSPPGFALGLAIDRDLETINAAIAKLKGEA